MNPLVTNLLLMFLMSRVGKMIDLEDERTVNIVRGCYLASNVIIGLIYLYTRSIINKKKDLTTIKYMSSPSPLSGEEAKLITTTIHTYDLEQIQSALKGIAQGIAMMGFMHLYMKYTNPLLMQSIMPLKSALESKIVQIHLFGKAATGDLQRPFKAPSMFGDMTGGALDQSDKKISAAETAGKGGKEE